MSLTGDTFDVADEVLRLARRLIAVDTTNGNETAAAEVLADYLAGHGITSEIVSRDPARGNLLATMPSSSPGPVLTLVGHLDVVPADARDWVHPPFAAVVDDAGYLHGRGALDMKGDVAARTVALVSLHRSGFRPNGTVRLLMVADEEDGSAYVGMNWLVPEHPELIRCDMALNEGGGIRYPLADGRDLVSIGVGEKGTYAARVTAVGAAGHASMPSANHNAVPELGELLRRIGQGMPVAQRHPLTDAMLRTLVPDADLDVNLDLAVARASASHAGLEHMVPALVGITMAPTVLHGAPATNVMPARASVDLDCRLPPGTTAAEVESAVRSRLGSDAPAFELSWPYPLIDGNASAPEGPLWQAISKWLGQRQTEALPMVCTGFTDSVYLRAAFATTAYGISTYLRTPADVVASGYHGRDERVHADDLTSSVDLHVDVVTAVLGGSAQGAG